jgi:uncharacterized protein YerC
MKSKRECPRLHTFFFIIEIYTLAQRTVVARMLQLKRPPLQQNSLMMALTNLHARWGVQLQQQHN